MSDASSERIAREPRHLPNWAIAVFALCATVFLFFFAQVVGEIAVSIYPVAAHLTQEQADAWINNSVTIQFAYGVIADVVLITGIWLALRWLRWDWQAIGVKRPRVSHLVIGLLAIVPYFALVIGLTVLVKLLVPSLNIDQQQQLGFESVHGASDQALTFLSLVVLPPITEEIVMRGFLYSGLRRWLPWTVAGLIVSVLFGAAHLSEGGDAGLLWVGAIDTFTLSVVLVVLREFTGNIWAGVVLHATKNCLAFVRIFLVGGL